MRGSGGGGGAQGARGPADGNRDVRPTLCGCGRWFQYRSSYYRHLKYECGKEPGFQCPYCAHRSKRASNLKKHVATLHSEQPLAGVPLGVP